VQIVLVYLQPFRRNSLLKRVSQPTIAKKLLKPFILGVQGHSRSSMFTFLKSSSLELVIVSSMSALICNHFHVRRANNRRITFFRGVHFTRLCGNSTKAWANYSHLHKVFFAMLRAKNYQNRPMCYREVIQKSGTAF